MADSPFKKYPCWLEKKCRVCGTVGEVYCETRGQVRNAYYCKQKCRDDAWALTRAGKLPKMQPTRKRDRSKEAEQARKMYKPVVWKVPKRVKDKERELKDKEYWRMLRRSYGLPAEVME